MDSHEFLVFRSSKDPKSFCLVKNESAKFPDIENGSKWVPWTPLINPLHGPSLGILNLSDVERRVDRDGYFAFRQPRILRAA
jgi:hypothetical protein